MSANSSTLLLQTEEMPGKNATVAASQEADLASSLLDDSEVTAGQLRVRKNSAVGVMEQLRGRRKGISLSAPLETDSSEFDAWVTALTPEPSSSLQKDLGFVSHLKQYLWSLFAIFCFIGAVAGVIGACIFYFGVVLPFGLN